MTPRKNNGTRINDKTPVDQDQSDTKLCPENTEGDDFALEDIAPDGGWGWMVTLAMIVVNVTVIGPGASFGIIFGDLLEASGQAGAATTLFNSVFMVTYSIAGLMTNSLMEKFSMRPVGVVGAIIFALPNVALAFVNNVYEMAFIYLLQGVGLGLVFCICNTNFNAYFVKRRAQVMSAAQVIIGFGGIAYPGIIEMMMSAYGFRGTALLTGALALNCIVAMMMMHPVEWHAKSSSREAREKEGEKLLRAVVTSNRRSTIDVIRASSCKTKWSSLQSLKEQNGKEVPLLIGALEASRARVASISEFDASKSRPVSGLTHEPLSSKFSTISTSSLASLVTGVSAFNEIRQLHHEMTAKSSADVGEQKRQGFFAECTELLEMSLLKDKSFLTMCFGTSFVLTSDYTFASLLPLMMVNAGYSKSDAAWAIMISASAELGSRIFLAIFTMIVNVKSKYLFFFAMICMGFARFGYLLYGKSLIGCFVMIGVIGAIRSWLLVPQPLVIIENVSIDKFASAYGIYAVVSGITSIVFGPIVGFVKDWTNSFIVCQQLLLVMNVLFVIPWGFDIIREIVLKRKTEKATKVDYQPSDSLSTG